MPAHFKEEAASAEAVREMKVILETYDDNNDGKLDSDEVERIKKDFADKKAQHEAVDIIRRRYDVDGDGTLDDKELETLHKDVFEYTMAIRYFGYMGALARSARYFRVLFKGVASALFLKGSYSLALSYITGDVLFELYHAKQKRATNAELAHLGVKRGGFQLTSSIIMPMYTIQAVSIFSKRFIFDKFFTQHTVRAAHFKKYGPAACALGTVPLLPFIWDKPVSFVFDTIFDPIKPKGNLKLKKVS